MKPLRLIIKCEYIFLITFLYHLHRKKYSLDCYFFSSNPHGDWDRCILKLLWELGRVYPQAPMGIWRRVFSSVHGFFAVGQFVVGQFAVKKMLVSVRLGQIMLG